jgi:hypothetical protein
MGKLHLKVPGESTSKDPRKQRAENPARGGSNQPNVSNQLEVELPCEENGKDLPSHSDDEMSEDSDVNSDEGDDAMKMEVDLV